MPDLSNLPEPVIPPPPAPVAPANGLPLTPVANAPADPVVPESDEDFMQRASNALNKLGINPADLKTKLLLELEAAAHGFENAKLDSDKSFFHSLGVRITAAIQSL